MKTRVVSAIVAIALLSGVALLWRTQGLYTICITITVGALFEFSRLAFSRFRAQMHLRAAFLTLAISICMITIFGEATHSVVAVCLASVFFLTMVLLTVRTSEDLHDALHVQGMGLMGFFYCGLFPGLATRLVKLDGSGLWLFSLLAIVFSGDTFAYLAGRAFGRHKLLEAVSPKKTIEGCIGGLFGSSIAGAILGVFFVRESPVLAVVFMALVTGAFAQVGDLYESLLKRVAEVKDSGAVMPGHGGILDRIDGVLFAAPVFYLLVHLLLA